MLTHLKEKLAKEWLEVKGDLHKIKNWFHSNEKEILMTLFTRVEAIEPALAAVQADVAALKALPAAVDQTAAIAAVEKKVDDLAALVGTPAA